MNWSWRIGRLAGVGVYIHWTFLLLLAWIGGSYLYSGQGWPAALRAVTFILAVFGCVVLHEFGHAATARRFGIRTRDITLYPIGGIARLERMPEEPMQEFLVAIAGPAVNVVIAGLIFVGLGVFRGIGTVFQPPTMGNAFFVDLMWVNVILVLFNALPAFPMDGGRVLRSLLAMTMDYMRATTIAARVGQMMALLFVAAGFLTGNLILLLIAAFVFLGAEAEARMTQTRTMLEGITVGDAMMIRFRTLSPHETLQRAADELLAGSQQDFPIVDDTGLRGILQRKNLVDGLRAHGPDGLIETVMTRLPRTIGRSAPLDRALQFMRELDCTSMPVVDDQSVVGVLTVENVGEMMMLQSAEGSERADGVARQSTRAA